MFSWGGAGVSHREESLFEIKKAVTYNFYLQIQYSDIIGMEAGDPGPGSLEIQDEPLVNSDSDKENVVDEIAQDGNYSAPTRGKRSRRAKCVKVNYKDVSSEYKHHVRTKKNTKKRKLSFDRRKL